MKRWMVFLQLVGVILLGVTACTPTAGDDAPDGSEPASPTLADGYENALSVQGQLALGTVQLDETELAVDEAQAADLLPLWQALQSLQNSDTAAGIEIDAVLQQIQDTMSPDQIQAIADMALTTDSVTALMESGELSFGFRGRANAAGAGPGGGFPGGGFPGGDGASVTIIGGPGGPGGGPGGRPGGAFIGGGFAGGGFPDGPAGARELNAEDLSARQAALASGELGGLQERLLSNIVILMLANKTGTELEFPRANIAPAIFAAVAEATGMSGEEIRSQMADGATLAEVIAANGGDIETVRAAVIDALKELPAAADMDVEQVADDWLGQQGP